MNSVSYVLNLTDYAAFWSLIQKKGSGRVHGLVRWLPAFLLAIVVPGVVLQVSKEGWIPRDGNWFRIYGSLAMMLLGAGWSHAMRLVYLNKVRRSPQFGKEVHLTLENAGVRVRSVDGESLLFWTAILSVEDEAEHCFLFLQPKQAIIVPKRALGSSADAQRLIAWTKQRWQAARVVPDAPPIASP